MKKHKQIKSKMGDKLFTAIGAPIDSTPWHKIEDVFLDNLLVKVRTQVSNVEEVQGTIVYYYTMNGVASVMGYLDCSFSLRKQKYIEILCAPVYSYSYQTILSSVGY